MVKQIIVVRKDLKMNQGKLAAQVAHASMAPLLQRMRGGTPYEQIEPSPNDYRLFLDLEMKTPMKDWLESDFTKIVLCVNSEEELISLNQKINKAGFMSCLIKDSGKTVFNEPTLTCLGVEPLYAKDIDPLTRHLKLLR